MPQSSYCWCDALNERSLIDLRGVNIVFAEHGRVCLKDLLDGIQLDGYKISILESTVYRDGKNVEIPNGYDIKHLWRIESECTIVSAIIKIYSNCSDNMIINTYEDFCNSNCDIIILIYDYLFYEIYLKKEDDIFKIIKNADRMDVIEIAVKTDKTDQRKEMAI